jgi:hypothetical protein
VIVGGLVALLLLAAGLAYWIDWKTARQGRHNERARDRLDAYGAFLKDIKTDRLDAAYQSTTASFQRRVSREAFEERARRYRAFAGKVGARGISAGGGGSGPDQETYTWTAKDGEGNQMLISTTVVQEDSILQRRPPPPRVAEFTVEERKGE